MKNMNKGGGWNQKVTDKEGRRRFHGAFTGGFSAGYYNTVNTKEGWKPKEYISFRNNLNKSDELLQQNYEQQRIEEFMDEEDDPLIGKELIYDKFNDSNDIFQYKIKENNKNQFNNPIQSQKNNNYGFGYDPFINAPEFRTYSNKLTNKISSEKINFNDIYKKNSTNTNSYGLSVLEENDDLDVYEQADSLDTFKKIMEEDKKRLPSKNKFILDSNILEYEVKPLRGYDGKPALKGFELAKNKFKDNFSIIEANKKLVIPETFAGTHKHSTKENTEPALYKKFNFKLHFKRNIKKTFNGTGDDYLCGEKIQEGSNLNTTNSLFKENDLNGKVPQGMNAIMAKRFVSAGTYTHSGEDTEEKMEPRSERSQSSWQPNRLLCKRFNIKLSSTELNFEINQKNSNNSIENEFQILNTMERNGKSLKEIDKKECFDIKNELDNTINMKTEKPPKDILDIIFNIPEEIITNNLENNNDMNFSSKKDIINDKYNKDLYMLKHERKKRRSMDEITEKNQTKICSDLIDINHNNKERNDDEVNNMKTIERIIKLRKEIKKQKHKKKSKKMKESRKKQKKQKKSS